MEYLQQKTPMIEKWEKELEDLLFSGGYSKLEEAFLGQQFNALLKEDKNLENHTQACFDVLCKDGKEKDSKSKEKEGKEDFLFLDSLLEPFEQAHSAPLSTSTNEATLFSDSSEFDDKSCGDEPQKKKKKMSSTKRASHNDTEKRRRDNINAKIAELKMLVPSCRNVPMDKAAILHQTINYLKTLEGSNHDLMDLNFRLMLSNNQLNSELLCNRGTKRPSSRSQRGRNVRNTPPNHFPPIVPMAYP